LSVTTLETPATARFATTIGTCWASVRIAESDMRDPARSSPSTVDNTRSIAARSARRDSWASASIIV